MSDKPNVPIDQTPPASPPTEREVGSSRDQTVRAAAFRSQEATLRQRVDHAFDDLEVASATGSTDDILLKVSDTHNAVRALLHHLKEREP